MSFKERGAKFLAAAGLAATLSEGCAVNVELKPETNPKTYQKIEEKNKQEREGVIDLQALQNLDNKFRKLLQEQRYTAQMFTREQILEWTQEIVNGSTFTPKDKADMRSVLSNIKFQNKTATLRDMARSLMLMRKELGGSTGENLRGDKEKENKWTIIYEIEELIADELLKNNYPQGSSEFSEV
jgi:hypothetical protein